MFIYENLLLINSITAGVVTVSIHSNLEQLLKAHGHEVAVFAMDYPENLKTQWSKYFPSEVKFKLGTGMIEALMRPFGTREYSGSSMRCSMISIRMWYISTTSIRNFRRSLQRWRTKGV